ncbi:hypothetical protein [Streptomyces sp. NBC_01185]|uniref:hypothetical protein n=1 Tax=Streptomyces sp. NBC_01185 TaxID=2903764 RepID=UPI0038661040|nr:hypothetical protein OG770_37315 [Streptomyces sp. NBC_01185]
MQGLILPAIARWAQLPRDQETEREFGLARTTAAEAALDALPAVAADLGTDTDVTERLRAEYETHLNTLRAATTSVPESGALVRRHRQDATLRLALLEHKRSAVINLRDRHRIDDGVLLQVQQQRDAEEVRLAQVTNPE